MSLPGSWWAETEHFRLSDDGSLYLVVQPADPLLDQDERRLRVGDVLGWEISYRIPSATEEEFHHLRARYREAVENSLPERAQRERDYQYFQLGSLFAR